MPPAPPDWISPTIRRLRAANPSPLTGTGTNSYILGRGSDVAVIDPGPDLPAHRDAILAALSPDERISHIFVTHAHKDHTEFAVPLARITGAPIYACDPNMRDSPVSDLTLHGIGASADEAGLDPGFCPDHPLRDGDLVTGSSWSLRALHTPGHLGDHLCFATGQILFSGDHVMGWSTTVVSPPGGHMRSYMTSLNRLLTEPWALALPGHGPEIHAPHDRITELIRHRKGREIAILAALQAAPMTLDGLAAMVYPGLNPVLVPAAKRNILSHLIDFIERNEISLQSEPGFPAVFKIHP